MSVRDIKPCPCCGGEANVRFYGDPHCTVMSIVCDECGLGTKTVVLDDYLSAVNAWNKRAGMSYEDVAIMLGELGVSERTCWNAEEVSPDFWFICSECRHVMPKKYSRYFESNLNYCPNCGAKVVE